ncbi:hypothetical protein RJ641_034811 [Dillenia turbinata]|uniref:Uncharacterized protein n=1 Tax=Dillenia turbinata TaxID=194707 RepID=A0AAN8VRC1_9MAGN
MATQRGSGLIHDQNSSFLHKGAASVAKKKGGAAGRRALGDLTNIANSPNKSLSVFGDRLTTSKPTCSTFKTQEKTRHSGRKAPSDLTNSGKPNLMEAPKKNLNDKLNAVAEVSKHEGFLHNHEECIKEQKMVMDMDYFLDILGFHQGICEHIATCPDAAFPKRGNTKLEELEEWPLHLVEDFNSSPDRQPSNLRCPPRSPASPIPDIEWYQQEPDVDFTLIEMP